MSRERMQKALDGLLYLPHLKEQHSEEASLPVAPPPLPPGSSGKGRPFDRGDLFRRLATFKSGTWFCKPDAISPVACARRGWTNTASDLLTCEVWGRHAGGRSSVILRTRASSCLHCSGPCAHLRVTSAPPLPPCTPVLPRQAQLPHPC